MKNNIIGGGGLQLHKRWLLISWIIILTAAGYSQTISFVKSIKDTTVNGIEFEPKGSYNIEKQLISLNESWVDARSVHVLLHELGHHIWHYGGIDTTMILLDLTGKYFGRNDVLELFAEEHWKYFFNNAAPKFKEIFEDFYHRPNWFTMVTDTASFVPTLPNIIWDEQLKEWIK